MGRNALLAWLDQFEAQTGTRPEVDGRGVTVDVSAMNTPSIHDFPDGYELILTGVGASAQKFQLHIGENPPHRLTLACDPQAESVEFVTSESLDELCLRLPEGAPIVFTYSVGRSLEVQGGSADIRDAREIPTEVSLRATSLRQSDSWQVAELTLAESISLSGELGAKVTRLDGQVLLRSSHWIQLGDVTSREEGQAIRLVVARGYASFTSVPADSSISIDGGEVRADASDPEYLPQPVRGLVVTGSGWLRVHRTLEAPVIEQDGGSLNLYLDEEGRVWETSGRAVLHAQAGSHCHGADKEPFFAWRVREAAGAEIENVALYSLGIVDLDRLASASRLSPWMPRRTKKHLEYADAMPLGGGPPDMVKRKQAWFWTRLSTILREKHASGSVQSQVRFTSGRARRRAQGWGREKALLWAYYLVGFGERIAWPLCWYFGLSLIVAIGLTQPPEFSLVLLDRLSDLGRTWVQVLLSPLEFFRLETGITPNGLPERVAVDGFKVIGLVLLFFTLLAIRRVAKAE